MLGSFLGQGPLYTDIIIALSDSLLSNVEMEFILYLDLFEKYFSF